jgi:flagellar motor switch/type III secretory pathway protein FliN
MVATLWSAIPDQCVGGFKFLGTGPLEEISGQTGATDWQWLDLTVEGIAGTPAAATIGVPISTLTKAVAGGELAFPANGSMIADALTAEASFSFGSLSLTIEAATALQSGDVVALPQLADDILVRVGWTSYSFRRAADGWLCVARDAVEHYRPGSSRIEGSSMSGMQENVGDLGIVLDFDLGRVTVPLSAVQTWQPGSIVALDPPASDTGVEVTIRANGQIIGNGDLIRIDDRIAVRLTRLSLGKSATTEHAL